MVAIVFALLAAASNAIGAVLQRRAALKAAPELTLRFGLILDLIRRPAWLFGFLALMVAFLCQAIALSIGGLTLVQPFVVTELPFTLLIAGLVFRTRPDRASWLGVLGVSIGLAVLMISLAPEPSGQQYDVDVWAWLWTCVASVGLGALLVLAAMLTRGGVRAALFGAAAGLGFGFTAALMKGAMLEREQYGLIGLVTSWQLYMMVAFGVLAFFLYQNAQHAGSLVASQPPVTTIDPLSSVLYGVLLFHEQLQGGLWWIPAFLGAALIVAGSIALSRSPLATGETDAQRLRVGRQPRLRAPWVTDR